MCHWDFCLQVSSLESELRKATEEITRLREEVSLMTKENIQLKVWLLISFVFVVFFVPSKPMLFVGRRYSTKTCERVY